MNLRFTIGFLVVAVVLGAVVFALDKFNIAAPGSANATATASAGQDLQLFSFDDSKVNSFEIRQGDKSVKIQKTGEGGWVVADSGEPANKAAFTSLIVRMSTLRG